MTTTISYYRLKKYAGVLAILQGRNADTVKAIFQWMVDMLEVSDWEGEGAVDQEGIANYAHEHCDQGLLVQDCDDAAFLYECWYDDQYANIEADEAAEKEMVIA